MSIVWKKKIYDPPGYTGAIWQEEVDGSPVTMPEVHEWYGYGNGRETHIVHVVPYASQEYWVVELGKEVEIKNAIFPRTKIFMTEKEKKVCSVGEAESLAKKWLLE